MVRPVKLVIYALFVGSSKGLFALAQIFVMNLRVLHCRHCYARCGACPLVLACQGWCFFAWLVNLKLELFNALFVNRLFLRVGGLSNISDALRYCFSCFLLDLDLLFVN